MYKPNIKIKKTIRPKGKPTFNETFNHINKELNKLK